MKGVSISNSTRFRLPPHSLFSAVAKEVLPRFDISLAFITPATARSLNKKLRGKNYTPNVLSYALDEASGEIIICPAEAKKQALSYGMSEHDCILYLFIHGLLHIKGWPHGATMEKCERSLLRRYGATYSHGHRYRHVPSQGGRRRRGRR